MLPFAHDEVVHGKGSLLARMPGDEWQKFANLRLLYLYMFTHPGTKCLFMGNEITQSAENSVLVYLRKGNDQVNDVLVVLNTTPVPRHAWRIGLPNEGKWKIVFNSDDPFYYGSGLVAEQIVISEEIFWHGRAQSGLMTLPPLGGLVLKTTGE